MAKSYLTEAFEELDLLDKGEFDFDKKGAEELAKFKEDDAFEDFETVIDPNAHSEDELQDSYIGMGILGCDVCHSMIYKAPEEIIIDEESHMANVGEPCPYCYETDGFKIIGKVAPFEEVNVEVTDKKEDDEEKPEPTVKVDGKDVPVDEAPEKEEEALTAEQKYPVQSPIAESLDENAQKLEESDKPAATSIEDAQKWVDYDMKRYGKISERTNELVKKAGFQIIKDDHSDYEVTAGKFESYKEKQIEDGHENTDDVKADIKNDHIDELEEAKVTEGLSNREKLLRAFPELNFDRAVSESAEEKAVKFPFKESTIKGRHQRSGQKSNLTEDIFRDASESCKQLYKELITYIGLKSYRTVAEHEADFTVIDEETGLVFSVGNYGNYDDNKHFNLWLSNDKSFFEYKLRIDVSNYLVQNIDEEAIFKFCDDLHDHGVLTALKNIGISAKPLSECISESMEDISITTDDQVIKVKATPRADKEEIEPITPAELEKAQEEAAPIDATTDGEEEVDVDLDEIDSESFDELGESYLKKVYDNVNSFKTTDASLVENKLMLEGVIEFASGKKAKTKFLFEGKETTKRGKIKFIGENANLSKNKRAFTLTGTASQGNLICEQLNYNYLAKDEKGASKRLYGTVRKSK